LFVFAVVSFFAFSPCRYPYTNEEQEKNIQYRFTLKLVNATAPVAAATIAPSAATGLLTPAADSSSATTKPKRPLREKIAVVALE
jgi:hypothetical protein